MTKMAEDDAFRGVNDAEAVISRESQASHAIDQVKKQLRVLPPSTNWYCAQICDWGYDSTQHWLVAFGAKHCIYLYEMDLSASDGKTSKPTIDQVLERAPRLSFRAQIKRGKKDARVTAVRFMLDAHDKLRLVCGGEEGAVQIWDVSKMQMVDQHRKHGVEVMAVAVRFELDRNLVVAGDRQGRLSIWHRDTNKVQLFTPVKGDGVFSMEIAPHDASLVAVGYRSGALCVVDLTQECVRYRLDGHDQEVQAIAWRPSSLDANGVPMLASSARDRLIKVWKFPGDDAPSLSRQFEIPKPKQASSYTQSKRLWLPVAWSHNDTSDTNRLWSGSFEGNLLLWQWSDSTSGKSVKPTIARNGHSRLIFSIVPAAKVWLDSSESAQPALFLTVSLDRELRVWREEPPSASRPLACLESVIGLGGHVYDLAYNERQHVLAAAIGDQTIRLWQLTGKQSGYQVDLLWKGFQSKITSVRWHPMQDNLLAYGTEDGRLGLYDVQSKTNTRLKTSHSGEVDHIEWTMLAPKAEASENTGSSFIEAMQALERAQEGGESLEVALQKQETTSTRNRSTETSFYLWSKDKNGQLYRTDPEKTGHSEIRTDCASFTWTSAGDFVAVGSRSGSIEVSTPPSEPKAPLALRKRLHEHSEEVTCLAWDTSDAFLASGSKDGKIFVFSGLSGQESSRYRVLLGYGEHVISALIGHKNAITKIQWSPSSNGTLASSSADGSVRVWTLEDQACCATFNQHIGRALSVSWIGSAILASGSEDQTIRIWNHTVHPPVQASNREHAKAKPTVKVEKVLPQGVSEKAGANSAIKPVGASSTTTPKSAKKVTDSFFHKDSILLSTSNMVHLSENNSASKGFEHSAREYLKREKEGFREEQNWEKLAHLHLLEGRIAEALRIVAKERLLTAQWVAYAPMASIEVWREVANLYALQLQESGDFKKAATQYLSLGKVQMAIQCFVSAKMYREAIVLIETRLGGDHSQLEQVKTGYAESLLKKKRTREAAQVLVSVGSDEALLRALHTVAVSEELNDVAYALELWAELQSGEVSTRLVLPTRDFLAMVATSLRSVNFELTTKALDALLATKQRSLEGEQGTMKLYRVSRIIIKCAEVIWSHDLHKASQYDRSPEGVFESHPSDNVSSLLAHFHRESTQPWASELESLSQIPTSALRSRAARVINQVLSECKENGVWFTGGTLSLDDVQDLLMDATSFDFLLGVDAVERSRAKTIQPLLSASCQVLKFFVELMNGYLLSALEELRSLFEALSSVSVNSSRDLSLVDVITLFFPGGLIDPLDPPLYGELADEVDETRSLWEYFRSCQESVVANYTREEVDEAVTVQGNEIKFSDPSK
ncbi:hypothetical protein Poli38472_002421 [Pythium oligandrum]|uniref:Anaphase-promoting complex subunit 4 WD40 domain-containing protein n=1 Tax=Pythium oligandrum TaxID=41045 RepID=A0A8K1FH39_PYTOL|nr:hypothetical protein Poli38472_002421 [Pythium oligandrum]|eukprot:TMW63480.1 hypothetical protein Poli38472_002421 [Pythium oligandrum]